MIYDDPMRLSINAALARYKYELIHYYQDVKVTGYYGTYDLSVDLNDIIDRLEKNIRIAPKDHPRLFANGYIKAIQKKNPTGSTYANIIAMSSFLIKEITKIGPVGWISHQSVEDLMMLGTKISLLCDEIDKYRQHDDTRWNSDVIERLNIASQTLHHDIVTPKWLICLVKDLNEIMKQTD